MNELVKRVDMVCYRGYQPKISCTMDPSIVAIGESLAKQLGLSPVPIAQLKIANGTPYHSHNGLDTVGRWNEKIYPIPCPKSKVKSVQYNEVRGHWLEYGNARVTVWQAHFEEIKVAPGQILTDDTVIGIEGATGKVTGKHLHTSIIIDGKYVDPYFYMTGQLKLPDEHPADDGVIAADGYKNWKVTDPWEKSIESKRYRVSTPGGARLYIRRSPGTDKEIVGSLTNTTIFHVDKLATLPDGQIWARLKGLPWHWVCLKRGQPFAVEVEDWPERLTNGYYVVRSSATDVRSQTGAFSFLSNARALAAKNKQKIYAPDGTEVK